MPQEKPAKDNLRWVRAIDPNVFGWIPRPLYSQIEGLNDEQIANLIRYGKHTLNKLENRSGQIILVPNELVHIAVLVDEANKIRGFLWAEIDIIEELIYVQAASVERSLQGDFKRRITEYLFGLDISEKCKQKIRMATQHPRAYERKGWKKSPLTIMEITHDEFLAQSDKSDPPDES